MTSSWQCRAWRSMRTQKLKMTSEVSFGTFTKVHEGALLLLCVWLTHSLTRFFFLLKPDTSICHQRSGQVTATGNKRAPQCCQYGLIAISLRLHKLNDEFHGLQVHLIEVMVRPLITVVSHLHHAVYNRSSNLKNRQCGVDVFPSTTCFASPHAKIGHRTTTTTDWPFLRTEISVLTSHFSKCHVFDAPLSRYFKIHDVLLATHHQNQTFTRVRTGWNVWIRTTRAQ